MTDKRTLVVDAAITLVGTEGLRALTHRRVDAVASVPAGSTSNYFRTRQALVEGVLDRLLEQDRVQISAIGAAMPGDARALEDLVHGYVMFATGDDLVRTRARLAMFVEAMATPELRAGVEIRRSELRGWIGTVLAGLGVSDSATAARVLIDYLDGLILHRCTSRDDEPDPRDGVARLVRTLLATAA
ncbi:TetR/AcrR family transcriptional regulator [Rhodococcus sp. B50]|uniref:TetR/AcrR family transcriptional regulator n=1 Tax=Rhodococcus sp. B50 TaxID=2682847 RepID=UPI001BD1BD72|nr:TetR family transcriptional regulator C-terminal domain-containing protein [Rhodococcus sp. B50]MBS9374486.1 HTH-type transcriptional regulator RcdA [Rhodococcus sp. B50]